MGERPMKYAPLVSALVLSLGVAASAQDAGQPNIKLSQDSWNFGEVWHGAQPQLKLVISNTGTAPLRLTEVRSTCGCTVAQPDHMVIAPGDTTNVPVRFDTNGKQGNTGSKVIIKSNDPDQPEIRFEIDGFVKRAIIREPIGGLVIRSLDPSAGQTGAVTLRNQMSEPMELKILSNTIPGLQVEIKEVSKGLEYEIVGTTTKEMPYGTTRGQVLLSTGLSREPQLSLGTQVRILRRVEVVPPVLYLRLGNDTPSERTVLIQNYGPDRNFRVTEATCNDPRVQIRIGNTLPSRQGRIRPSHTSYVRTRVALPKPSDFPKDGLIIEFKTTDPEWPVVRAFATNDKSVFQHMVYGSTPGRIPAIDDEDDANDD
jgi:hypothetical protein